MALASFNLMQWIEDNRALLRPPVLNRTLFTDSDFIVQIVGGPNVRTDYHDDPYEEFFYQLKGDIVLKVVEDGALRDVPIAEGNVLLLPPHVPHSPQRPDPESIGLVVERARPADVLDAFEWYCGACATRIWRREVHVADIVRDLPPVFEEYYGSVADGACPSCGAPNPKKISVG
ncbi:MAG: 3-hydroxyanthranilate 3,4-dioxygenase [Alphaproteobacteria bacterium]|nr:3-hydroxyanthranilate 3,4-dioxygenase [Alphaproteobacteria bacterium]